LSLPNTPYQLLVLLVLLMPGIVYATVRYQLRGPIPDEKSTSVRVLRALMVSVLLNALYALALGPHLVALANTPHTSGEATGLAAHPREVAAWALLLIFVVPAVLAFAIHGMQWQRSGWKIGFVVDRAYRATPTAWDHAAPKRGGCYVRIMLNDGRFVGGYVGPESYVSSYPEAADIFIDTPFRLYEDGTFGERVPGGCGLYLQLSQAQTVEWQRGA
jgi:hypothetical protein